MGAVYEVVHEITRHPRALKLLHPEMRDVPGAFERFLREASAAGRIGNPHIVDTFDAGEAAGGEPYLVMELLEGEPMSALINRAKTGLGMGLALELVAQAAEGVQAAHEAGIVHRDLKPDNVFLVQRDGKLFVKLLDFGISKFDGEGLEKLTQTGQLMGTPAYMPPEQLAGQHIDERADVYALGVILFKCVTGRVPYVASSIMQLALLLSEGSFPAPSSLRAEVPPSLEEVMRRALARSPDDRTPTAGALASELRRELASLVESGARLSQTPASAHDESSSAAIPSAYTAPVATSPVGSAAGSAVVFPGAQAPSEPSAVTRVSSPAELAPTMSQASATVSPASEHGASPAQAASGGRRGTLSLVAVALAVAAVAAVLRRPSGPAPAEPVAPPQAGTMASASARAAASVDTPPIAPPAASSGASPAASSAEPTAPPPSALVTKPTATQATPGPGKPPATASPTGRKPDVISENPYP